MTIEIAIKKKLKEYTLDFSFTSVSQQTALLGASGSGKSMILKCIAGIETPDEGYIRVNGRTLFDKQKKINLPPQKRRVGYLFQNYALFPNFTVRQNIACVLQKKDRQRVEALLHKFELTEIAEQYSEQLSGGQQQRVALARLLASDPEILLLDEPFSALDTFLKEKVELEMKSFLQDYPGEAILVTHNRNEAYRLCEDLVILNRGRSIEHGKLKQIFDHPRYLATSKLTGCKNFSRVERLDDHHLLALDWNFSLTVPQPVTSAIRYVGIRAHFFEEAFDLNAENCFKAKILDQTETPFEWRILCQPNDGEVPLWWKLPKEKKRTAFSGVLHVPTAAVQLLQSDPQDNFSRRQES